MLTQASKLHSSDEILLLTAQQAWRRERLDLAELFLGKLAPNKHVLEAAVAEDLADVLYEIGRNESIKQSHKSAIQWLERAYDILLDQSPDDLSLDASALQSCIMHTLVHALLRERCEENTLRAWGIIQKLENGAENAATVALLKLQVSAGGHSSAQDYHDTLVQLVRQIHLSDVNVRTILHHVHELQRRSPSLAHTALVVLLSDRLLAMDETAWVEKILVTIIWNLTTSTGLERTTDRLEELLDTVAAKSSSALGTSATHAAQIVRTYSACTSILTRSWEITC